jgi:hypothetical protein
MLREALTSISAQTEKDSLLEVLVSENSPDLESEKVCGEFPDLPLRFYRNPNPATPGTPEGHRYVTNMLESLRGEFVAILFDDDWWDASHLKRGLYFLSKNPQASAYYGSVANKFGFDGYIKSIQQSFWPWVFSDRRTEGAFYLNFESVLLSSLFLTNYAYPSLIARRECLNRSYGSIDSTNPYDTDRELAVRLSLFGELIYNPEVHVYMRLHEARESIIQSQSGRAASAWRSTTKRLLDLGITNGLQIQESLTKRLEVRGLSQREVVAACELPILKELRDLRLLEQEHLSSILKRYIKELIPPFLARYCGFVMRSVFRKTIS